MKNYLSFRILSHGNNVDGHRGVIRLLNIVKQCKEGQWFTITKPLRGVTYSYISSIISC